jgi:phenylalanyl-tRNA synthetase beta chain
VKNVTAELSPAWLQKRIETSGMRPINLLVDATNYVMLEYGQPVHAYDVRDINGALLSVRTALGGEELVTLDGQKRQLVEGDLLICDAKGPIGLAGVMGGQTTEVKADTKEIIIEVAAFSPLAVRKTARRLSLHSEASKRFERGINIDNLPKVAHRVAEIIANASGGQAEIAHDHIDEYSDQVSKRVVTLRLTRVRDVLGTPHLTGREVEDVLTSLEFEKLDSNLDRYVFEIPFWRNDIDREIDLIEEVARIRGYEKITSTLPVMSIKTVQEDPFIEFAEDVRVVMASSGFNETITFPFLSLNEISHMGVLAGHPLFPSLSLANPISEEHRYLHTTLLPGLLRALVGNRRQGVHGARLFECGRAYFNGDSEPVDAARYPNLKNLLRHGRHLTRRAKTEEKRPHERHVLAGIMDQPFTPKNWDTPLTFAGFFHGKAAAEGLMKAIAVGNSQFQHINPVELPFLHPGAAAQIIVNGKWAGFVGELHPKTAAAFNLAAASTETATTAPVVFELDLELLFNSRSLSKTFDPLQTRFPPISRDFAFLIDAEKTHQDVAEAIRGFKSKKYLSHYKLFDIYTGDKLPSGKKSMAYSFEFQAERTLTEKDVEPEIEALMSWLGEKLGLTQRK